MSSGNDTKSIDQIIEAIELAAHAGEFWRADELASRPEDLTYRQASETIVRQMHEWIKLQCQAGVDVSFSEVNVRLLSSETAFATAIQELKQGGLTTRNRATFIFLKQNEAWGVIHAHYSSLPQAE